MAENDVPIDATKIKEIALDILHGAEILSIKSEQAVAEGEHYLSTLLRAYINFRRPDNSTDTLRIILKTHPKGILSDFVKISHMFNKELISYHKILPRINEIVGKNISPLRLGSIRNDVLVLEDLKVKGFQMKNRVERLDFCHAKEALIVLADFHAASIVVHDKNPEFLEELKIERKYTDDNTYMRSFIVNNFKIAATEFEKTSHLKKYSERLRQAGERVWEKIKEEVKPRNDEINVFNHGDFWTTNILYNYDVEDNIKEISFVDFQFCRWGSPAFDLQMLFATSVRNRDDIPKLTVAYLERLNKHLYPNVMTAERLDKELRRLDCFAFLTSVCTMPICTTDPKNPLDFGETTLDDFKNGFPEDRPNPYLTGLRDKGFLNVIPTHLEFYEKMGLL